MLCSNCKEKPATVHLTQIVGDKMQKLDLCEECAKAKGVNDPGGFALADLMLGLGASQELEQSTSGVETKCPRCGSPKLEKKLSTFASSVASGPADACCAAPTGRRPAGCGGCCGGGPHHH